MTLKYTFMLTTVTPETGAEGFSEGWYSGEGQITPQSTQNVRDYVTARMVFTGGQTVCNYARISTVGSPRLVQVIAVSQIPGQRYRGGGHIGADKNLDSDFSNTAFLVRKTSVNPPSWAFTYLRGIDDFFIDQGGRYDPTAAMRDAFAAYVATIVGKGWGWLGKTGVQPGAAGIANVGTNQAGQAVITFGANTFPGPDVGKTRLFTIKGVQGAVQVNGTSTWLITSTTSITSIAPLAIFVYTNGGTASWTSKGLVTMTDAKIFRVVSRRAGRPSFQSAGRRRVRRHR